MCSADELLCTEDDHLEQVHALTNGQGAHGAVDCAVGEGTADMVSAVRPGGTVLL